MFEVMARFRGLDELALLGRVAESPGIALVPGLSDEVRGVLKKARDRSSLEPEFRRRVRAVVAKASDALGSYAGEQRGTLERDLLESAGQLSQTDRERVFRQLWESAAAAGGDRLAQVRAIDEARECLDRAKKEVSAEANQPGRQTTEGDDPAIVAQARAQLETAITRGGEVLAQAASAPDVARKLLQTALADASASLTAEGLSGQVLAEQCQTLESVTQGLADAGFGAAFAPPASAGTSARGNASDEIATKLRRALGTASEELERVANLLPTAQVIQFRMHLQEAEAATHTHDVDALQRQLSELKSDAKEMQRLAEQQRGFENDRNAAEARRLAGEIEKLAQIAQGRDAKQLQALRADLDEPKKRARVAAALPALAARVANKDRLTLATRLHRAKRCSEKAQGLMQAEIDDAAAALSGDDLTALGAAAEALGRALRQAAPWRGPRGWIVGTVLLVAILVGGGLGWRSMNSGLTTATFEFELAAGVDSVKFVLVHGGEIVTERSVSAGQSVNLDLPAGRFEVFVNDHYTGRVVQLPQDAGSIAPIVVPQ